VQTPADNRHRRQAVTADAGPVLHIEAMADDDEGYPI
jgi:hypothetical protein